MDAIALSQELRIASQIDNPVDRVLEIMAVLTEAFASVGHATPVLVGGGAVDYYTGGKFGSRDIDALLYTPSKVVDRIMGYLAFSRWNRATGTTKRSKSCSSSRGAQMNRTSTQRLQSAKEPCASNALKAPSSPG